MWRRLPPFIPVYLIVCTLAAFALLVDTWPRVPRSWLTWGLLPVVALPVTVLGDWLSDNALSTSLSLATAHRARRSRLAWVRFGYCLAMYILFAVCTVFVLHWLQLAPV
jgi:hypothetical protein